MQSSPPQVLAVVASGTCILTVGVVLANLLEFGVQSQHMATHILSMNILAPLLGATVLARWKIPERGGSQLWFTTAVQLALLWAWHTPALQSVSLHLPGVMVVFHAALLLAATAFWVSVFALSGPARWQAIPALLLTGKLVCLLAALLVFSPRAIYASAAHAANDLDDQHLAGLLMIAACPLCYLVAAVVMTVHLIGSQQPQQARPSTRRIVG
jgi:putative membrane protein